MYHQENAQQLSNLLELYKAQKPRPFIPNQFEEQWGAAYFYAALLKRAVYQEDVLITHSRLIDLAQSYRQEYDVQIDVALLLEKDWLRIVWDRTYIPYLTSRAIDLYEKVVDFKEEFLFFDSLVPEEIKSTKTKDDLIQLAGGLESKIARSLDATRNLFWYERNGCIELPRLDDVRNILNETATFGFLSWLGTKMEDNLLRIGCEVCLNIHQEHSKFFTNTPTINELIKIGILQNDENGTTYQLHMGRHSGFDRNILHERYSGILWQDLVNDEDFADDMARVHYWYYRIIYHQGYVDISNCFNNAMMERFLDAAVQIVLNERDLTSGRREYFRLLSDSNHAHDLSFLWEQPHPDIDKTSITTSLYETHLELNFLFKGSGLDILVRQRCRHVLIYLIVQLVKSDNLGLFNRLQAIFDQSQCKPYGLWESCFMITHWRPELLPFMAIKPRTASLAYALMLKADLTTFIGDEANRIRMSLIKDQGQLIVKYLSVDRGLDKRVKAQIIFECLLHTTYRKFRIERSGREENILIAQHFRETLLQAMLPGQYYDGAVKVAQLFIVEILNELICELESYKPVDVYRNGLMTLPFIQLDLATWFIEMFMAINETVLAFKDDEYLLRVVQFFSKTYLEAINAMSIDKRDYFGDKTVKASLPSWTDYRSNDRQINWGIVYLQLQQHDLLDEFLRPASLVFTTSNDPYDEVNRFVADKLRTHLFILIDAFSTLFNDHRKLELRGLPVDEVLTKIEMRIKEIVVRHAISEPAKRRFDIFGESFERWFSSQESQELLPIIASLINRFSAANREAIIQALMQSDQFVRSLKMLERIVSEKERLRLLQSITQRPDFKDILEDLSFQDMQFVTSTLSQHDSFIAEAEEALNYTEQVSARHSYNKRENEVFIFRMRLLNAYHKRNLSLIEGVEGPEDGYLHDQHFRAEEEKDFYRALILMKTGHGKEGYEIFDQLERQAQTERPVIVLNRFAAKLQWAAETSDLTKRKQLAAEALEQWELFDAKHSDKRAWPDIKDNILFDLLDCYEMLEDYAQFDRVYADINIETRMRPDFLDIRVKCLLLQGMQFGAEQLLAEAKQFHRLSDGSYPEFVQKLENRMNTPETLNYLSSQYDRIYRLTPDDLVKLIPASVNNGKDLSEFLLNELTGAAKDMLKLVNVLPFVNHEDKYSDLIMLSLNGRIRSYRWHVANLRSGFSDPEKSFSADESGNLGLVDFAILNGLQQLAICEAMILGGKNTIDTQKHNLKVFNYDPGRRLFYLIIYYKGGTSKFLNDWIKYQKVVEDFIEFPKGYELSGNVLPIDLQPEHDGIIIGVSKHGNGTQLYHMFVNVEYHLNLRKKTASEDK